MSSFHYEFILSKRSSLAKVWLAAHWEKKLSKVQIFETNLQSIVQDILHPKAPIALRTSSHLLVGLVRIYSRKAKYLLKDCSDTLVNIKVAFRPGVSNLNKGVKRKESSKEIMDSPLFITEKVDLLDHWIPEFSNAELDCTLNQCKAEEITLQEEPMKTSPMKDYFDDEGFGEMDSDTFVTSSKSISMTRACSLADSAYGTEEGFLGTETSSLTDYSDPFSSLTPAKDVNSSPLKLPPDHDKVPKLSSDVVDSEQHGIEDHYPPFSFENNIDATATEEARFELHLHNDEDDSYEPVLGEESRNIEEDQSVFETKRDVERVKQSFESLPEETIILTPFKNTKIPRSARKAFKRKLLIDDEIFIERKVIFDNLNNSSQLMKSPVFAPSSKQQILDVTNDVRFLVTDSCSLKNVSPVIKRLCSVRTSRNTANSTAVNMQLPEETDKKDSEATEVNLQSVSRDLFGGEVTGDSPKMEEFNSSAHFIPLQEIQYSSDEENPIPGRENELDFIEENLTTEQNIIDENISEDKFCSFVETKVLEARPKPVEFQDIIGGDGMSLTRKTVASRFVKCLLMQRDARLSLRQDSSFGTIFLHPGLKNV